MTNHIGVKRFGRVVEWLASHGFDVLSADGDIVRVARGDDWAGNFQRLHMLIPSELHLLTCGGNETPMIKIAIGDTLVISGLTDRAIVEAQERWNRLRSDRLEPGTRILAKGQPGAVDRDNRHELLDSERVVWVKLDAQKTKWPLGFYPENVVLAKEAGEVSQ